MHPLLINLGPIPIHTYGFLIAIGFLTAVFTIRKLAEAAKLDAERALDLTFWLLLVGFLGARVLFILTRFSYFMSEPLEMLKVWEGGLVFFGGPLACVPYLIWYVRRHQLPTWKLADALIPGLVIAHVFGRLGCLSAGCCYGKPTGSEWGIRLYSDLVEKQYQGIPLHPTQLYEASALFILFCGLLYVFRHKRFDGQVVLTYFMAYPIIRSIVEIFRGDLIRGFVIDDVLSTSQFISILVFLGATAVLFIRLKQVQGRSAAEPTGPVGDAKHA
jgi:phosphatidylglycerol:prolipoprotein diacylglycerol transferase